MRESWIIEETSVAHMSPMSLQPRSYAANVFKRNVLQYVDFHLYRRLVTSNLPSFIRCTLDTWLLAIGALPKTVRAASERPPSILPNRKQVFAKITFCQPALKPTTLKAMDSIAISPSQTYGSDIWRAQE